MLWYVLLKFHTITLTKWNHKNSLSPILASRPVPVRNSTIKEERKTDGLSSENHPACSQTPSKSVCFSLIQYTHNKEMHITKVLVLLFQWYYSSGVSFHNTALKSSPCDLCMLCVQRLRQTFMCSNKIKGKHHTNMLTFTCSTSQPKPQKQISTFTHTHTHTYAHTNTDKTHPQSQAGVMTRHGDSSRPEK